MKLKQKDATVKINGNIQLWSYYPDWITAPPIGLNRQFVPPHRDQTVAVVHISCKDSGLSTTGSDAFRLPSAEPQCARGRS